jgi:CheY-like chemotaxis protein
MESGGLGGFSEGLFRERYDALMRVPSPNQPRILLAEHDPSVAEFLSAFLKGEGYALSLAPSLDIALRRIDEQTFHIVLTDLFIETPRRPFSQVRRLLQHALPTPVGLITGWQVSPEAAHRQGFAFLLAKPFDLDHVLAEISACLYQELTPEQEQQFQVLQRYLEALGAKNLEVVGDLLTEDILYHPPLGRNIRRVRGLAAMRAYIDETHPRYRNVTFDEFLFYPRPKGWAQRFCSHWSLPDGSRQNLTGTLLFHFRGERIHQIGIQWSNKHAQTLLENT